MPGRVISSPSQGAWQVSLHLQREGKGGGFAHYHHPSRSSSSHPFVNRVCPTVVSFFFKKIFIVVQLQLSAFSPHPSTPPQRNPPPSLTSTLPLDFVHVSFIVVPVIPSPHCLLPTPLWLLLDCSQQWFQHLGPPGLTPASWPPLMGPSPHMLSALLSARRHGPAG